MIWFLIFLFSCYAILIISLAIGFVKIAEYQPEKITPKTNFSVIIPFRNEAQNLPILLKSIEILNYPRELVEFLFVDDASSDDSLEIITNFIERPQRFSKTLKLSLISNNRTSNSPKKDAITTAIYLAKNNWIITTDADCILPEYWLKSLDGFIQEKQPKMVVAPVNYKVKNNFLEQFQLLDFMSLQGTTIGGFGIGFPFLCNGANLAYQKEEFLKLNGFKGNDTIASGDDIFLFEKFTASDKKSVRFLKSKDAIVTTFPVKNWTDLMQQRVRWASKTSKLKSSKVKLIGILVFLINLSVFLGVLFSNNILMILLPLFVKISVDLFLFLPTINFYNHKQSFIKWYIIASILYPFFSVYIVFKSLFSDYKWKGRNFKK